MKRIAICFDGTGNRSDAEWPTNVVLMTRVIAHTGWDDVTQLVQYYPGVGSGRGTNAIARAVDRALGGALAFGLRDVIEEAYRGLVFAYDPGDEVFIFGFSRGAFTARVFAGLLRSCGIGARRNLRMIPEAIARHLSHADSTHPDTPESVEFRARFSPDMVTGDTSRERELVRAGAIRFTIPYVGLWDTVRSFSVLEIVPQKENPFTFDGRLSHIITSARHAMSIDERRWLFPLHRWTVLEEEKSPDGVAAPRYIEAWFPGDHGSVGGGGNRTGLSGVTFRWIAIGAARAGLRLIPDEVMWLAPKTDPVGEKLENRLIGGWMYLVLRDRWGPAEAELMSLAALERLIHDPAYGRRRPMRRMARAVAAMTEAERAALRARLAARDDGATFRPGSPWWVGDEDATYADPQLAYGGGVPHVAEDRGAG